LKEKKFEMRQMPYQGNDSLWSYGPIYEDKLFLVAILPYAEVLFEANAAQNHVLSYTETVLSNLGSVFLIVIIFVLIISFLASRNFSRPVQELASATKRLTEGDFAVRVQPRTFDEIGDLGEAFNQMVPQLQERINIKQSLELAREVQQQLLPSSAPTIKNFDVAGLSIYCDETGGDYFDYLNLSRNGSQRYGLTLGDITGHGIAGALLMANARALLRANAETNPSLGDMLTHVNRQLSADVTGGKFMTLFFIALETETRLVRWSSAGHDPALLYRPDAQKFEELDGGGPPLGIDNSQTYQEYGPISLQSGDIVVMATDGVWESANSSRQRFGKDRLRQTIQAHASKSAKELADEIYKDIKRFLAGRPQQDDITLVVLKALA
jgi:phosphoserine phosphatase RsbU/P